MKNKTDRFTLRLEPDLLAALDAASKAEDIPAAQIVRQALKAHLKKPLRNRQLQGNIAS